jgi:protein-S-isoprenylcysteine O-methyltransferase Ste14
MIESIIITLFPCVFLIVLFGGGSLFERKNIDMGGNPPIDKRSFIFSKYSIIVIWAIMVLHCWDPAFWSLKAPALLKLVAFYLWGFGFSLLFVGRFGLGASFRIGSPQEQTSLKTTGLFKFSRNPMYVGVYATILASVLYTLNPMALLIGIFVVSVHHKIVLAEEHFLSDAFGQVYIDYCVRVRRYL